MTKKWILRAALVIVAGVLAWLMWSAAVAGNNARLALADLRRLEMQAADPSLDALPALFADLVALDEHLTAARSAAAPFLWLAPRLGWLPQVGPTVAATPALLEMATELSGGARIAADALAPLGDLARRRNSDKGSLLERLTPALAEAVPALTAAETRLARAETLRNGITGPLHPRLTPYLARLDRLLPLGRVGLQAAQVAPALLGAAGPRTYLILAQNNHELRATGGFISGVGVIKLDRGRIVEMRLGDSYAVDNFQQPHPNPPPALAEQMGAQLLVLRDSNWWPDFPTSATVARALMQQDQGVATDGAIALDLEAVRLLVTALGPLETPNMGQVTAENVIETMKQAWADPATSTGTVQDFGRVKTDWWLRRKDFMSEMLAAAMTRVESGTDLNLTALAQALLAMLDGRHLQVVLDDPAAAALLASRGWDGGLRPPPGGDFLAVVDSNVGFNKTNAVVQQAISYRVERTGEALVATLILTYTHTAPAWPATQACNRQSPYGDSYDALTLVCFFNYLRVYTPSGSELLAAEGLNRPKTEFGERGTTVLAGDFVQRPGSRHVVTLRYRLPAAAAQAPYRLFVRKQAGTLAPALRVEAPPCAWQSTLAQDRTFICQP